MSNNTTPVEIEFFVDYDMSLEAMIKAGHYDVIETDITAKRFPLSGIGQVAFEPKLFHFNRNISSKDVIKEMEKQGFRPATIEDLLAYGAALPEEQRKFSIVALGSVTKINGDRYVAYLSEDDSERGLYLGLFGFEWDGLDHFLGVRK